MTEHLNWTDHSEKVFHGIDNSLKVIKGVEVHNKLWKFWDRWKYQTTLPISSETCMQIKKQQLETHLEQLTGSKLGKDYIKAVECHPVYLTYMQSAS